MSEIKLPWPDDDVPRNTAEVDAYLMSARSRGWPHEQQPDGTVTEVQPEDMSEAEKNAILAEIDADERMKIKSYDALVTSLAEKNREIARLQEALMFWLPMVPDEPEIISKRVASDAWLLAGYQGECQPNAEHLGWIKLTPSSGMDAA